MISPDVLSTTTYGYQTAIAFGLNSSGGHRGANDLVSEFLGMSQVSTQVSKTKILDALVTGHTASELPKMVQYTHICTVTVNSPITN